MNQAQKIGVLRSPQKAPTAQGMAEQRATPSIVYATDTPTGAVRRAIDDSVPSLATPLATLSRLRRSRGGDVQAFVEVVEPILEQDLNYASAVDTVVEALTAAPLIAEPSGKLARDKRVAAEIQEMLLDSEAVISIIEHLASVEDFGFSVAELIWNTTGSKWFVENVIPVPPKWITFDKNDARTPMLLPAVSGGTPEPLEFGKFVYCALPGYGLPYLRSHGFAAAFYKALADMTVKDWAGFLEMYGQPMRKGTFDPDSVADKAELEKSKKVLKEALKNLGTDAWAMLPKGLDIELLEAATKGMSSDLYERFIRFIHELITKRKTGAVLVTGTGNTGSGGSQALGSVHNEAFERKIRSLAKRIASAIRRYIVEPYVRYNYGEDTPVPFVRFGFEDPEDIDGLSQALERLVPLGLKVSQEEVRDRLGLRAPADGEEMLAPQAAPQPAEPAQPDATTQANTAMATSRFASENRDAIDDLTDDLLGDEDYIRTNETLDDQLLSAIEGDGPLTAEQLQAALVALVKKADVSDMQAVFTAALTAGRAAGELGGELDNGNA